MIDSTVTIGVRFLALDGSETEVVRAAIKGALDSLKLPGTLRTETVYTRDDGAKVTTRLDERITEE